VQNKPLYWLPESSGLFRLAQQQRFTFYLLYHGAEHRVSRWQFRVMVCHIEARYRAAAFFCQVQLFPVELLQKQMHHFFRILFHARQRYQLRGRVQFFRKTGVSLVY
jgi:hypothetical protein